MDNKEKKDKKGRAEEPSLLERFQTKFKDTYAEFKKIIWPDRKALVKHTVNVIIVCGIIGAIIVVMDIVFSNGYNLFIGLFN